MTDPTADNLPPAEPSPGAPPPPAGTRRPRFFSEMLPHPRLSDPMLVLNGDESYHARKVLRLNTGDEIDICDGEGGIAHAVLLDYDAGHARCRVLAVHQTPPPQPSITVATAIPKGPRGDDMFVQLSQLGADRVIPMQTARSIVHPRPAKLERYRKMTVTSAKQCLRPYVMKIDELMPFKSVLNQTCDVPLLLAPGGDRLPDMQKRLADTTHVLMLIGPEGGWSKEEVLAAQEAGFIPWSVGPNVLRIETAAAAAISILRWCGGAP